MIGQSFTADRASHAGVAVLTPEGYDPWLSMRIVEFLIRQVEKQLLCGRPVENQLRIVENLG
jgi:hypothetical protein